ncbi:hypothetical protein D3C84_714820 [compost metagenome]
MHAEGGKAGVIAIDHVEQQAAVGELIEGQRPLGQHGWRQFAGVLRDQEAQAFRGINQRGRDSEAFVGAGTQQRTVVTETVAGHGKLFQMFEIGCPAAFGFPRIRPVGGGEVPENFYSHGCVP